jgi:3-oxoacyl-[acyl-carrier protein] reductase
MKKSDGKIAVVTGASKGIGASIAKHLAAEGAAVVVNYASSKEGANRVVDEITSAGGKAITVQADMSKKAEVEQLFAKTQQVFGKLDILINNAGIYAHVPLEDITEEHFHKHFDLNVLGLILTSQQSPLARQAAALSTLVRSPVPLRLRPPRSIAPPKQLSMP